MKISVITPRYAISGVPLAQLRFARALAAGGLAPWKGFSDLLYAISQLSRKGRAVRLLCGCTPVSTDCPTGPREVLQVGRFGYLVPVRDPAALAAGIERALDRPISKEGLAVAVRPFEEKTVLQRHFEILGLSTSH
jgi:hypothetical protein